MAEGLLQYVFLRCRFFLNLDLFAGASKSISSIGFHSSYIYGDWKAQVGGECILYGDLA